MNKKDSIERAMNQVSKMSGHKVQGRAYTREEKRIIVERLFTVWTQFNDYRLGQLISNATFNNDLFNLEDEDLVVSLEKHLELIPPKS